jgi:hypothetical protein
MRLMLDGKLPTEEELKGDELITQMLQAAEEKGKTSVKIPTTEEVVQALKVEDLKENAVVKQMVEDTIKEATEKIDKKAIIQSATKEDLKDHPAISEMLTEGIKQVKFTAEIQKAIKDGNVHTAVDDAKKSVLRQMTDELSSIRI